MRDEQNEDNSEESKAFLKEEAKFGVKDEEEEDDEINLQFEELGDVDPVKILEINMAFEEGLLEAEADTFWCLSKLIDDIQDNFLEM